MAVVTPDLPELFEEAYERAGLEMRSGYDLKTARRSLNILTLEWQNRGLNLFTIEAGTLAITASTSSNTKSEQVQVQIKPTPPSKGSVSRPTPSKPTKTRKAGQPKSTSKGSPRKSK